MINCMACRAWVSRRQLIEHVEKVHPERIALGGLYRCLFCATQLEAGEVAQHLAGYHAIHKPMTCRLCHETIERPVLLSHVRSKHPKRLAEDSIHKCLYCPDENILGGTLVWHLAVDHAAKDAIREINRVEEARNRKLKKRDRELEVARRDPRILVLNPELHSAGGHEGVCDECGFRHIGLITYYATNRDSVDLCKWCRPKVLKRTGIVSRASTEPRFVQGGQPGSGRKHR